ncbi:MAG: efflux RND transporter periplasmic adaptor subunit [Nitrospira sp.]
MARFFLHDQRALPGFLVCLALAGVVGCKDETASAPPPHKPPPPSVQVLAVLSQNVADEPEFIGQSESSRPVEIRSQVTGIVKQRFFQEGRDVKKGHRLYQIDPVPFQAAVASAKAMVAQTEARLVREKQNLARVKPLLKEQAVSQKDVDDAVAEELAATAALEGARAQLVKAKFDLDNTRITSPIDGLIERTRVSEGRLVSAQTDLLTIVHQTDPMYVIVSAPERFLLQRRRELAEKKVERPDLYQLKGTLTFSDGTVYPRAGQLDFTDVGLRTETGARQGRFVFPNPERVLLPGQFVKVRVQGYVRRDAILVPQRAVQQGPKGPIVFLVNQENKIEIRPVQATGWQGDQWLIENGLKAGDRVVLEGLHLLAPGAPVNPVPVGQAAPAPPPAAAVKPGHAP